MKNLTILLFTLFALKAFGQGDAPPFIQGQSQTAKSVASVIKAPNSQTTKLSSSQALLETGNKNLLVNPSFEHQTYGTGWTNVGGTSAVETTIVLDGAKSFKSTQAATFVSFAPSDVTAYQAQFADGSVSALASISVKAGFSVKICARKAGVTTSQCSNGSRGDSKWETIQIAFPLGATSNGFEVVSDATATGAIYFDDAYLGFNPNFSALVNLSTIKDTQSVACTGSWTVNTTYTCNYYRVGEYAYITYRLAISGGAPSPAVSLTLTIPSSIGLIDTAKLTSTSVDNSLGSGDIFRTGVKYFETGVSYISTSAVGVPYKGSATGTNPQPVGLTNDTTPTSPFTLSSGDVGTIRVRVPIVGWTASSPTIVTTNDTFSTDTASLFHKTTACLSTEIGCFNTYSYAINSNTKTICGAAPSQSIASMNTNGIQIFTRAYNAPSTCGNPARVELVAGKKFKGIDKSIYKNTGKSIAGGMDTYTEQNGVIQLGASYKDYSETEGVVTLDAGVSGAVVTSHLFLFSDNSSATSGYVVINASKNPAMSGIDVGFVAARCINTSAQSIPNTGYTKMSCTTETKDTHGSLDSSGTFTARVAGNYRACGGYIFANLPYIAGNIFGGRLSKNSGASYSYINYETVLVSLTMASGDSGCDDYDLAVGDTLHLELLNGRTAGATALDTFAGSNFFTITKNNIGN